MAEATRVIVFEGFADQEPGWDFDMPVYMIHPVKQEGIGGSVYHAENMVEDYLINLSSGDAPESEEGDWRSVMRQFRAARGGRSKRFVYWRQEVYDVPMGAATDDDDDAWDRLIVGELHIAPTPGGTDG